MLVEPSHFTDPDRTAIQVRLAFGGKRSPHATPAPTRPVLAPDKESLQKEIKKVAEAALLRLVVMYILLVAVLLVVLGVAIMVLRPRRERDLKGAVVLMTGAGGGLGRLMSLELARRGCRIACVDVAAKPNDETVHMVLQQQQQQQLVKEPAAKGYTADLSKREDIANVVKQVIHDFGCVDILVSNAGQLQGGAVWDLSEDQVDLVLDVNLRASILLVRALVPHMKQRRSGHLVAISSLAGLCSARQICVYGTTKAGLSHFMDCVYHDLHDEGFSEYIHVTTVQPFFMSTYGLLNDTIKFPGILGKTLLKFLDPQECAAQIVHSIASRQEIVNMPQYMAVAAQFYRLLPRYLQNFCNQHVVSVKTRPAIAYSQHRHGEMDEDMLHDLLSKDYPLHEDPQAVCSRLNDAYLEKGKNLPHDFPRYADRVQQFYAKRNQEVPAAVRCVFGLVSS